MHAYIKSSSYKYSVVYICRFLLPYEKRLQNYSKKKNKPNGAHEPVELEACGHQEQIECKSTKEGRLVIRLPLKFKQSADQTALTADCPSYDSDDKPLSQCCVAVKSNKKKKKSRDDKTIKVDSLSNEQLTRVEGAKKVKVKKVKTEKQLKRSGKAKVKVDVLNRNGGDKVEQVISFGLTFELILFIFVILQFDVC